MKKVIFSGIQPSGNLHIGNYIGAIKQWVELQNDGVEKDLIFCVVDLHAITVPQDPKLLREKILEVAALFIASGIDPRKAKIFVQSENPDHASLTWLLNCITPFGQLERMTQFKDKSEKQKEGTTAGLFDYPVLMASDILLYNTTEVPVGEDQKQHIELTRDLAEKFNRQFGEVFVLPEPRILKETARIMSLQNPTSKMSKSDDNQNGAIMLLDNPNVVREKIKRAVTDSGSEIRLSDDKPAMSNLLRIFSAVTSTSIEQLESDFTAKGYGEFKSALADAVVAFLQPLQARYRQLRDNDTELNQILSEGASYAKETSAPILKKATDAVGLGRAL